VTTETTTTRAAGDAKARSGEGDFVELSKMGRGEVLELLALAARLKAGADVGKPLAGKVLGMIFRKSSTRTRVSFEVGMLQLGGHAVFLSDHDSQLGRGETIHDTAKVLSGYLDGIMIRTFSHQEVRELARHATIPVINGLTDMHHPCQVLADLQTVQEEFGPALEDVTVAWIGDGNNVAHSWIEAAGTLGFELRLACPEGYEPDSGILGAARAQGRVTLLRDPDEAVDGAHVVTTDVWASMGHEEQREARLQAFHGYTVDDRLMEQARANAIFLHCLPAHRGEEVAAPVIDGPASRIFAEAENRLHAQKALLLELLV
jgi:ornithine carbamoyltransferase